MIVVLFRSPDSCMCGLSENHSIRYIQTFNSNWKSLKCIWFANSVNIKVFWSLSTDKRAHIFMYIVYMYEMYVCIREAINFEFQTQYNDDSTQFIHKYKHLKLFTRYKYSEQMRVWAWVHAAMHFVRRILKHVLPDWAKII